MRLQQQQHQQQETVPFRSRPRQGSAGSPYTDHGREDARAHGGAHPHAYGPLTGSQTPYSYYFAPRDQQIQRRAAIQSSPREGRSNRLKKKRTTTEETRLRPAKEQFARPLTFVEESKANSKEELHRPLIKAKSVSASTSTTSVLLPSLTGNAIWLNRRTHPVPKPSITLIELEGMRHSSASGSSSATLVQPSNPSPPPPPPPIAPQRVPSPTPPTSTSLHCQETRTMSVNPTSRARPISIATTLSLYSQMSYPHALQLPPNAASAEEFKDWLIMGKDEHEPRDQRSIRTVATAGSATAFNGGPHGGRLAVTNQRSVGSMDTSSTQRVEAPTPSGNPQGKQHGQRRRHKGSSSSHSVSVRSDTSTLPVWEENINEVQDDMKSFLDMSEDERHSQSQWCEWYESSEQTTPTTLVHSPHSAATAMTRVASQRGHGEGDEDNDSTVLPRRSVYTPSPVPTLAYIVLDREERHQYQLPGPSPLSATSTRMISTPAPRSSCKTAIESKFNSYKPGRPPPRPFLSSTTNSSADISADSSEICVDYDYSFAVDVLVHGPSAGPSSGGLKEGKVTEEIRTASIRRRTSKKSSTKSVRSSKRKMRVRKPWKIGIPGSGVRTASNSKKYGGTTGSLRRDGKEKVKVGKEKRSLFSQVANFFSRS